MKIVFISSEKLDFPSAVHRCILFKRELEKYGIHGEVIPRRHIGRIIHCGFRSDLVIFQRYMLPPAQLFLLLFKAFRKKTIFDFDDSIFYPGPRNRKFRSLKRFIKTNLADFMIKNSHLVVVGSHYLAKYAQKYNHNVSLIATPVDTDLFRPSERRNDRVMTLGWFGSGESHFEFLKLLKRPLQKLARNYEFRLVLLGCANSKRIRNYFCDLPIIVDYGPYYWINFADIPKYLSQFDINLMPLTDDPWARGKCGIKILEAMAMKIPSVASRVGESRYIIEDGTDGFLAENEQEFTYKLGILIENHELRRKMGERGRKKVEKFYSLRVCATQLLDSISLMCR